MRRFVAYICSFMFLTGIAIECTGVFTADAAYTEGEVENVILSASDWIKKNADPLDNIGTEVSDISVISFARAGIDYDYGTYLDGLDSVAEHYGNGDSAKNMQRSLMAVIALGGDSGYFGGRNFAGDATYNRELNGAEEYIGALTAVNAGDIDMPYESGTDREEFVKRVISYQAQDGSFGDVYTTAAAVIALSENNDSVSYNVTYSDGRQEILSGEDSVYRALKYLSAQQTDEGDFYTLTDTAMVALALDASGTDVKDDDFVKNNNTVIDGILNYRETSGGFSEDFNGENDLATAYALCALVSHARKAQGRSAFFDFTSRDEISLPNTNTSENGGSTSGSVSSGNAGSSVSSGSSSSGSNSTRATTRPRVTTPPRSTTRPRATMTPRASVTPSASALPRLTPKPTERPALVGPAQIVGPIPIYTDRPETDDEIDYVNDKKDPGTALAAVILAIAAAAVLVLMIMAKKKIGIFKVIEKKTEIYRAKRHRRTEEHRRYEERRKFEKRGKYNERGKYKGRK